MHGEPRAVHVHRKTVPLGGGAECRDFVLCVHRPPLRCLAQAQRGRLDVVHAHVLCIRDRGRHLLRRDFPIRRGQSHGLGAAREEFRCATFIGDDVRRLVAIDGAVGGHHLRQGQRIGGGPGGHREYGDRRAEYLARNGLQFLRQNVAAVGSGRAVIRCIDGSHDGIANRAHIIALEISAQWNSPLTDGSRCLCRPGINYFNATTLEVLHVACGENCPSRTRHRGNHGVELTDGFTRDSP